MAIVLSKSDFIYKYPSKYGDHNSLAPSEITAHFHRMLQYHRCMDGNVPNDAVIFIGDSITQGLCVSAIKSPSVNYGIGGDTTVGILQRLSSYKSIERASAVVIAIGINDMCRRENDEILKNLRTIIEKLPGETPLIFSAVLPIDEESRDEWKGLNQQRIKKLNLKIKHLSSTINNAFFVDIGLSLTDDRGNLADIYHTGDGVHLNSYGNAFLIDALKKELEKAQKIN